MLKTRRTLVIAALVHVGVLGVLGTVGTVGTATLQRRPSTARPVPASAEEEGVAIELTPASEPTSPIAIESPPTDHEESAKIASVTPAPRAPHVTETAEPELEPSTPTSPMATPPSLIRSLGPASIGIALGAPNAFAASDGATLPDVPARAAESWAGYTRLVAVQST